MSHTIKKHLLPPQLLPEHDIDSVSRRSFLQKGTLLCCFSITALLSVSVRAKNNHCVSGPVLVLLSNHIRFNGYNQDNVICLQHFGDGYRAYNSSLLRFHAMDSLSPFNEGGCNAYGYVYNDPVNYNDPSGHRAQWVSRLSSFIAKNPAETTWMGVATVAGVVSGSLWAASTQVSDSETVNNYNLAAGILAAVTAGAAAGAWVSSKNPMTRAGNQIQQAPVSQSPARVLRELGPLRPSPSHSRSPAASQAPSYREQEPPPPYEMRPAPVRTPVRSPYASPVRMPARVHRPATPHHRQPGVHRGDQPRSSVV